MRRLLAGIGLGLAATLAGGGTAQAWTWASSSSPIVFNGGGGYGNLNMQVNDLTLQSWLRDTQVGDGRVYAKTAIIDGSSGLYANLTSGERSDGESSYARMADQSRYVSKFVGNYSYRVNTCRGAVLQDPCSEDTRTYP
ncbi:hypothetical protein [Kineococcus arenarius]|uniref:hypothetical protein n=1 Tax=Kineococcus sp. SYSU DK020 TaxID=3383141 RepID=UPI003D7CEA08